jgi:hypothetical protein
MKRLDARALRYQLHRLFVTTMLAVAALSLLAEMARAQSGDALVPSQCVTDAENLLAGILSSIEEEAELGHTRCDQDFAPELFGLCVGDPI